MHDFRANILAFYALFAGAEAWLFVFLAKVGASGGRWVG